MTSSIRFLRWDARYRRQVGSIDSLMNYGVQEQLVRRGIAEFVTNPVPMSVAAMSEPVATTDTPKRRKRSDTFEE
jgi:hypothetical protein